MNKNSKESEYQERNNFIGKEIKKKEIINKDLLEKINQQILDNFLFKFSSLVCSLEYEALKNCFENTTTSSCINESKYYGSCLYRRYEKR
jgi:3-methyladenine DNA glycosylase AlkD